MIHIKLHNAVNVVAHEYSWYFKYLVIKLTGNDFALFELISVIRLS